MQGNRSSTALLKTRAKDYPAKVPVQVGKIMKFRALRTPLSARSPPRSNNTKTYTAERQPKPRRIDAMVAVVAQCLVVRLAMRLLPRN
jgi:hypothetical protein